MKDNYILEMIKKNDTKSALKEMELLIKKLLLDKLNKKSEKNTYLLKDDLNYVLEICIQNLKEYYDILTYLRNLCFFSEKSGKEKLYELAYVYENLSK